MTEETVAAVERSIEDDLNHSIGHRTQQTGSLLTHFMEDCSKNP